MPDRPDAHDLTPEARRALGIERGFEGDMLEHFVTFGGFEALGLEDVEMGWDRLLETHDLQAAQDDLVRRFAVKTGSHWNTWRREAWPEEIADRPRWPLRLMEVARRGDELWWYSSSPLTWEHLCGRAGWALLRGGRVIDRELVLMN